MEKIVMQTYLYDFYGELLTKHQKDIYEDVVFHDMSLSEAAEQHGISRQGIHDIIKRCNRTLKEYEEKLGLIEKFIKTKELVREIHVLTKAYMETGDRDLIKQVERLSSEISRL